ncbi:DUF2188 domain-containing protein [Oceanobacillus saliphilus]|uniref:DUF2188 domain-containing protein n=1 Tax=Oceanobacillus saliphilus TaxID=2925834 RepID=UPI00201E24CB|nr:DUF2188 domain-containing protein [Oceanobacillus saliphilus]
MPWTMDDYPSSMKNLNEVTKKKAIDIANAMVDEGYEEGRAIPIAIEQAKEWRENASNDEVSDYKQQGKPTQRSKEGRKYQSNPERLEEGQEVVAHEDGWAVKSSGAKRASEVFANKDEAMKRAREIAKNKGSSLTIYKQDGSVQNKQSYNQ